MNPTKFRVTKTSIGEDESDATYESFNTLEEFLSWVKGHEDADGEPNPIIVSYDGIMDRWELEVYDDYRE